MQGKNGVNKGEEQGDCQIRVTLFIDAPLVRAQCFRVTTSIFFKEQRDREKIASECKLYKYLMRMRTTHSVNEFIYS